MSKRNENSAVYLKHSSSLSLLRRLWKEALKPYRFKIALAIYFMIIAAAGEAAILKMLQPVIDRVFVEKNIEMLLPVTILILLVFSIKSFASFGHSGLMNFIGLKIVADIQDKLFNHIIRMNADYFQKNPSGSLVSKFTVDSMVMKNAVANVLTGIGKDAFSVCFLLLLMFHQDAKLAAIVLFVLPIGLYPIIYLGQKMRKVTANIQVETGELNSVLEETLQGIRVIKSYNMEAYEKSRSNRLINRIFDLSYSAIKTRALARPVTELVGGLALCIVIVYGGHRVIQGYTTPGEFFSFIGALLSFYVPVKALSNLNISLQEGLAGAERIFNVLDEDEALENVAAYSDNESHVRAPNANHSIAKKNSNISHEDKTFQGISIENLRFTYGNDAAEVLGGVSLQIPKGHTIAIVGASGAGKSTLINLILGFYKASHGNIFLHDDTGNKHQIDNISLYNLRKNISLVSQDIALFDDTVAANITYGAKASSGLSSDEINAQIEKAAKAAYAHDFIIHLPGGYQEIIGERGSRLSGGQRQRLAIARAIFKNAPILLLDEATSALDNEAERKVQKALDNLMRGKTSIVIAHRLSTIMSADRIFVMEDGRVVESGSHEELLAKSGSYAKLYQAQFAE